MRLSKSRDVTLSVGFAIAVLVTFQGPIAQFLQRGREIEEQYGLALIPGLAILISVLLAHHLMARFRQVAHGQRRAESTSALALSQALAHATSWDTVQDVLRQKLVHAADTDDVWVAIRESGQWRALATGASTGVLRLTSDVQDVVAQLVEADADMREGPIVKQVGSHLCFPVMVGESLAVLGVPHEADRDTPDRRISLAAAATSIGMALRTIQLLSQLEEQGIIDGLTGCFNRTHGMKMLDTELKRAKRAKTSLAVVMLDLDYFKSVNDRYGHLCGDALLTAAGKKLHEMLRNSDVKCRYGGEEFLILLPDTPRAGAIHVGDMLRAELERVSVEWDGKEVSTTASIGITIASAGELDPKVVIARADEALYRAKHAGRNQVCVDCADDEVSADAESPPASPPSEHPPVASDREVAGRRSNITAKAS